MARPLPVQFSGALYRVTARGSERKPIFRDQRHRPAQVRKYLSQYPFADAQAHSLSHLEGCWSRISDRPTWRLKSPSDL